MAAAASIPSGTVSEFSVRLPSAIGGGLFSLWTYLIAARLFGPRVGRLAAFVLISSPLVFFYARVVNLDMTLAWLVAASLHFVLRWGEGGPMSGWFAALAGLCLGLSALTKGPVGPLIVIGPACAAARSRPPGAAGTRRHLWLGAAAFAAVTLPWPLAVVLKLGGAGAGAVGAALAACRREAPSPGFRVHPRPRGAPVGDLAVVRPPPGGRVPHAEGVLPRGRGPRQR